MQYTKLSSNLSLNIINDSLDFTVSENDKLKVEYKLFNVKQLCEELYCVFNSTAQKKGIILFLNIDKLNNDNLVSDPKKSDKYS
ncbi:MAG: hypothetical protein MJK11_09290 [Pseudomonadales bacterium]|nr:hypothetical protein [Pseudomonadales bacterium]